MKHVAHSFYRLFRRMRFATQLDTMYSVACTDTVILINRDGAVLGLSLIISLKYENKNVCAT